MSATTAATGDGLTDELRDKIRKVAKKIQNGEQLTLDDFAVITDVIRNARLKPINAWGKKCACFCTPLKYLGVMEGWEEFPGITMTASVHIAQVHTGSTDGWVTVDCDQVTGVTATQGNTTYSGSAGGDGSLRIEVHSDMVDSLPTGLAVCQRRNVTGTLKFDEDQNGFLEIHFEDGVGEVGPDESATGSSNGTGTEGNEYGPGAADA